MNGANSGMISAVYETHFYYQHRKIVKNQSLSPFVVLKSRTFTLGNVP